jgi:uncharacterized protein (TIGR02266 family)
MSQNTRKDPRAKVLTMTVRYRSATIDEFIEHHSYDVSRGGMFIKTPSPFPAGTLLKFEVKIAEDQKVMQGVGRVVWKREQSDSDADKPCGMGVKFIKIDEESRAVIERLLKSRAPGGEGAYDSGPVPAPGQSMPPAAASVPPSGPVFPATSGSERPPEDRTVLKPAAELLQDALQQAGSAGASLPAIEPSVAAPEASVETKRSSDRSEPPPVAEEAAAAAWAHDALASLPDKESVPPPSSKRAGAVTKPKEATPVPAPVEAAPAAPARISEAAPERRPSRRPSRPPLAEVEEEGGGGKAVLLLLVAAAGAAGIYFLTKRGHEVPPEPSPPAAVQAEPTVAPAPSPAPEVPAAPSAAVSAVAPEPSAPPSAEVAPTASAAPAPEAAPEKPKPVAKVPRAPRPKAAPKPAAPKEEAPAEETPAAPSEPAAPTEPAPSEPKATPAPAPTPKEATPPAAPESGNPY